MNDPAMLLHIIQCRSDAVFRLKHRGGHAETLKTQLSTLEIPVGGVNQLW